MSKPKKDSFLKALVIGDLHFRWQNDRAIALTLRVADGLDPDLIIINGDLIDNWEISKHDKSPRHAEQGKLREEIGAARRFLGNLRKRFSRARIVYIFGNHEFRWEAYIARNAKELYGLYGMTLEEQLDCAGAGVEIVNPGTKQSSFLFGKLLIGHFDRVCQASAYTAKALLDQKGISLMQNHTHRGGSSFKRNWDRDIVAYENFCLCDRNPTYVDRPNWQLGFSIVYKAKASDYFFVEQHPIAENTDGDKTMLRVFFNGQVYVG